MATITKRGDGQFKVQIRKAGHAQVTRTCATRKDAEDFAKAIETDMLRGEFVVKKKVEHKTLSDVLQRYAEEVSSLKKGEKQELVRIAKLRSHDLAKKPIDAVTPVDIEDLVYMRRAERSQRDSSKTVSEGTIRLEVMLLSAVFEQAKSRKWNYCRSNPCREIDSSARPGKATPRERRFEDGEEVKFFEQLDKRSRNSDIPLVCRFALFTAARQSELIGKEATSTRPAHPGLLWEDIKLDAASKRGTARLRDTKNGKDRTIPLNGSAYELLAALPRPINGGSVFDVTQDGLIRAVQAATKEAKIEGFTFHCLRHEATSRMVEQGLGSIEVQAVTGHSTAEMVRYYTHIDAMKLAQKMA